MTDEHDADKFWAYIAAHQPQPTPPPQPTGAGHGPVTTGDVDRYVAAVCHNVATAANGTRNAKLNGAAYTLGRVIAAGQLYEPDVVHALTQAGHAAGLDDDEIPATIASGLTAGRQHPRALAPGWTVPDLTVLDQPLEPGERTSWWPQPIATVVTQRDEALDPTQLARDDGHRLFYAGRVNGLLGESESGKTWVALHAVHQALAVGETILYLDFEDSAKGIDDRLRLMGATDTHLERLHYANPDEALGLAQRADLAEALGNAYTLVVIDGVNASMTLLGLDVDSSNAAATTYANTVLRPIANTGAAVVTIDHVPKNKEARGKGGIGAQAKRAMTRGCALAVEVATPFGPGMEGELRLTVDKDTTGKVRAVSGGAKNAGTVHIDSTRPDQVVVHVAAPDLRPVADRDPFRPTHLMEKVSRYLETLPAGCSGAEVERGVGGKRDYVRDALGVLVDEGYVIRESGPRGAVIHRLIAPYSELTDMTSPTSPRPRPDLAPGEVRDAPHDLAPSPPPLRGARGEVKATGPAETTKPADLAPGEDDEEWWQK